MRVMVLLLVLLATPVTEAQQHLGAPAESAPDLSARERIAAANVSLTALLTVARGVAEGRVRTVWDGAEVAAWGALSGAGFYFAKDAVGRERGALGVGLAFPSASLAENAARGDGLLGHVRVGFGPIDLRVRTPLATDAAGPALSVDVDPLGVAALVAVPLSGGRPAVRDGVLLYVHPDAFGTGDVRGTAIGRVIVVGEGVEDLVVRHETIHWVQAVQTSAVTPYGTLGRVWPPARVTSYGGAVQWDLRADWLHAALGGLARAFADGPRDGWHEVEAYELDSAPLPPYRPPCPPVVFCPQGGPTP